MKILFLAAIATKRNHFDGEVNKSKDIYEALKTKYKVKSVNFIHRYRKIPGYRWFVKFTQVFKMLWFALLVALWNPDYVFIAKAPYGAAMAIRFLKMVHYDFKKTIVYVYGLGLDEAYLELVKNKEDFKLVSHLIVENEAAAESFEKFECKNLSYFPCIKKVYELPADQPFKEKETLSAIFFARLIEEKGLFLAIDAVKLVNGDSPAKKYTLDIAGPADKETEKRILDSIKGHSEFHYYGKEFTITGIESYKRLQNYDLNVFPSWYHHECAPGSVVDMFIAGVPTVSSTFPGCYKMMDESSSYFVRQKNLYDLVARLEEIYTNQKEVYAKRSKCREASKLYSYDAFLKFFAGLTEKSLIDC